MATYHSESGLGCSRVTTWTRDLIHGVAGTAVQAVVASRLLAAGSYLPIS